MDDIDANAIQRFRTLWRRKSANPALDELPNKQLLADAELLVDDEITYAALILLGTRHGIAKALAQAEVVFEYRSRDSASTHSQRKEYREGFFLYHDDLWNTVNLRNEVQHFQDGLFLWDIPTFNETVVREAILNAVSHRDYRLPGSVFVRQFPKRLEIVSPGGFPPGITPANIVWRQSPRNRRIAEAFAKCGLVERSGQGANRMFEQSIKESKLVPDFTGTDAYQVAVTLHGEIRDPRFLRFLEQIGKERVASFCIEDLLVLDLIHREQTVPEELRSRIPHLFHEGIIERVGRGKGTRYILSRGMYGFLGKRGVYTRKRGLDRETNKALLMKHIQENKKQGCQLQELRQVLPSLSRCQVQSLLQELKREGRTHPVGRTRAGRWFPGPDPDSIAPKQQ